MKSLEARNTSPELEAALDAGLYTDEYLQMLNSVLSGRYITPIGGYCVGVVEAIVRTSIQKMPSLYLLQVAADCTSVAEAISVAQKWIEEEIAGQGHGMPSGRRK